MAGNNQKCCGPFGRASVLTTMSKLPNFYNSSTVEIQAYVKDEVVGQHEIVLEIKFIQQLGLIFDYHCRIVSWDEISIPMGQKGSIPPEELFIIEDDTSNILKKQ
jgi:hypothetical protein